MALSLLLASNTAVSQNETITVTDEKSSELSGTPEWIRQQLPVWYADSYGRYEKAELLLVAVDLAVYDVDAKAKDDTLMAADEATLIEDWKALEALDILLHKENIA